jgi:hypothetical protein
VWTDLSTKEDLDPTRDKVRESLTALYNSLEGLGRPNSHCSELGKVVKGMKGTSSFLWDNYYASTQLDKLCAKEGFDKIRKVTKSQDARASSDVAVRTLSNLV